PYSILFRGCSFCIPYEVGVVSALRDLSPDIMKSAYRIYGASSGSVVATAGLCGCDLGKDYRFLFILRKCYTKASCQFSPICAKTCKRPCAENQEKWGKKTKYLCLCNIESSWKISVALCSPLSFPSHPQAIMCSCFIPLYMGISPPKFRGVRYVDGELAMWRANFVSRTTITISSFAGEYDICPKESPAAFLNFQLSDCILQISKMNICRLLYI
ncbi:PLPL1 protein, partial [Cisticola juncidis]|nr:PLPL1 protein [Cisticola juncidis]